MILVLDLTYSFGQLVAYLILKGNRAHQVKNRIICFHSRACIQFITKKIMKIVYCKTKNYVDIPKTSVRRTIVELNLQEFQGCHVSYLLWYSAT